MVCFARYHPSSGIFALINDALMTALVMAVQKTQMQLFATKQNSDLHVFNHI